MKKFKIAYVIWAILLVIILALLTYLGFTYENKMKPYKDLEETLINKTQKYIELEFLYPEAGDTLTVTLENLKAKEVIDELKYEDDVCDGYVKVTFNGVYNYKAYIKCNNYETKGY